MGKLEMSNGIVSVLLLVAVALISMTMTMVEANYYYGVDYYKYSCPSAEKVITAAVTRSLLKNKANARGLVRLHFHDCFVRGCDGSVLIDSPSEKDAIPNLSLHGFEAIDDAKAAVEKVCPGVVSCADVLALAAQLSVKSLSGGKIHWEVPLGRKDGNVSSSTEPLTNLPSPLFNASQLTAAFAAKGLSQLQMVTLSGVHSIGVAHCPSFFNRLTTPADPTLDPTYAAFLKSKCPSNTSLTAVNLDVTTPTKLDEVYYKNLQVKKGLLTSDEALQTDPTTRVIVAQNTNMNVFGPRFASAMRAMGNVGVLTGNAGNIRLNCRKFN